MNITNYNDQVYKLKLLKKSTYSHDTLEICNLLAVLFGRDFFFVMLPIN